MKLYLVGPDPRCLQWIDQVLISYYDILVGREREKTFNTIVRGYENESTRIIEYPE
jgi:hypothetical protein